MSDNDTMTVKVRDRAAEEKLWGGPGYRIIIRTISISAFCPRCGGRRGEPRGLNQMEDGESYHVNIWDNPCGHEDNYRAVIVEADA